MRFRFRTVLVTVTLALLLATVGVIGVTSFLSARDMAEDLSGQVLGQAAQRVEQEIHNELGIAIRQSTLNHKLLASGRLAAEDGHAVARYFLDAIHANPQLSYLSWGLEKTGNIVNLERKRTGYLELTFLTRQPDNRLELEALRVDPDESRHPVRKFADKPENDPRSRPYYKAAREAGAPTWTETYTFLGTPGSAAVPGVTRATPVFKDGTLLGVLTADFDLFALCEFLGHLKIGEHGMAFLIELRGDGSKRVIAHPEINRLSDAEGQILPTAKIDDGRVQGFLEHAKLDVPDQRFTFEDSSRSYIASHRKIEGDRGLHWVVAVLIPEQEIIGPVISARRTTIAITIVSTIVAIILAILLSMQIARTLRHLATETEAIARFHLEAKPVLPTNVVEVKQLAGAIEDMKRGLRSFRKFVPADLVRHLVASGDEAGLGGKRANITVHFSDIADFTTISEKLKPEELVELLGEYLGVMSDNVLASGGTIDKYIGDAIMAFWNAPRALDDHAFVACKAVMANQTALAKWRVTWAKAGKPELRARIGLHTGDAVVGNIGTEARLDYTAIGDTVNLASRLEGLNKGYGTEVIISESTLALVEGRVVARPIDRVAVKGKATGILIYELIGMTGEVDAPVIERAKHHATALDAYFACKWDDAIAILSEAPPDDKAAALILERARRFKASPPPEGWDGVHRMTTK